MPHLHATQLFSADGLLLRRVTCDGVDDRRLVEERNNGARIILVLRGRFAYRDRETRAVASPCAGLYLQDGQTFYIRHMHGEGDVCLTMQGEIPDALIARGSTMRRMTTSAYVRVQFTAARLARGETLSRLTVEGTLCDMLAADAGHTSQRVGEHVAEAIVHTIEREFPARLSLAALARVAGVSVFQASRAFKRATGMSIHRYHQEIRLRHALALLLDTDRPLARIAVDVGFANQPHFTTRFRRRFHVTPHQIRRTGRFPEHPLHSRPVL